MCNQDNVSIRFGVVRTIVTVTTSVELSQLVASGMVSVRTGGPRTSVSSIHFYGESGQPDPGALIAAVGAGAADQQKHAVEFAVSCNAKAIILDQLPSSQIEKRCREAEIALAVLDPGVQWSHLIWFIRTMFDRATAVGPELAAQHGLFAMADAVASMLNAPVTIEDAHSRVVAYSATTDVADVARTSTIMTRAVPPVVLRRLRSTGVLKKLTHESRPFIVPALEPGFLQRLVVPLRVGGQAVGSIWAIWNGDLDAQLETQLTASGTAAALSLVQLNASLDAAGRYSLEAIRTALRDGTSKTPGALDLPFHTVRVVALQRLSSTDPADDIALWRTYLRKKSWPDPILADVDGLAFAIVSDQPGPGGWPWLRGLAETGSPGLIAGSRPRSDVGALPAARQEATEALTAVRIRNIHVAAYEDVWDTVTLRRATVAVAAVEHDPLRRLHRDDPPLADTLRVWLECGGDIRHAAATLHLHPNTVRHRLKKIDLLTRHALQTDTQRLAALMLLRSWEGLYDQSHE